MKFQKDQKINGFTLCEEIGDGAFSNVFAATHEKYTYPICIKIQKNDKSSHNAAKNEIEMLRTINSFSNDSIINLLEDFTITDNDESIICMVFKKYNYDLHTFRKNVHKGKIPYTIASKIYKKILSACKTLHDNDLIHTDIKPDNILINTNENGDAIDAVLSDFGGCEKYINGNYSSSLGTPEYQAPEIIVGYPYDHTIDTWALVCTFYEMITGDYLFDPTNHNEESESESEKSSNPNSKKNNNNNSSKHSKSSWRTMSNEGYYTDNSNQSDDYYTDNEESEAYSDNGNSDLLNLVHLYLMDQLMGRMDADIVDGGHYSGLYFDYKSRLFGMLYKEQMSIREFIEEKESNNKFPVDFTQAAKSELIGILTDTLKYKNRGRGASLP